MKRDLLATAPDMNAWPIGRLLFPENPRLVLPRRVNVRVGYCRIFREKRLSLRC